MKKIIYSLVIMIAAGSLFTSCIDQVEPVGILDMRTAKAEYIRALKDLRAADAEYRRAEAAVQLANAAYRQAETAWMQEQVNNQKLLNELQALYNEAQAMDNELKAAQVAKQIADLEFAMEEAAAQHEINMVNLENNLAKAEEDLRVTLRNIALAAQELTTEERQVIQDAANYYWKAYEEVAEQSMAVIIAARKLDSLKSVYEIGKDVYDADEGQYVGEVELWKKQIEAAKTEKARLEKLLEEAPDSLNYEDVNVWKAEIDEIVADSIAIEYNKYQVTKEMAEYYVNYVHDGQVKFNEAAAAWNAANEEAPALTKAQKDTLNAGEKTQDDFKKKQEDSITTFKKFIKSDEIGKVSWTKFAYLLNSYKAVESPYSAAKNVLLSQTSPKGDTLYFSAPIRQNMKDFILGYAGADKLTVTVNNKKLEAKYGLKGAYDVLSRELVTKPYEGPDAEEAFDAMMEADSIWEAHRQILIDGLAKYQPFVDTVALFEAAQAKAIEDEALLLAAIKNLYLQVDAIGNQPAIKAADSVNVLVAVEAFAAVRDSYLTDETEYAKGKNPHYFYFAAENYLGQPVVDSVLFSEIATQAKFPASAYQFDVNNKTGKTLPWDHKNGDTDYKYWAIANVLGQLFNNTTGVKGALDVAGNTGSLTGLFPAYLIPTATVHYVVDSWADPTVIKVGTEPYAGPKEVMDLFEAVKRNADSYAGIYNGFWGATSIAVPTDQFDAYFAAAKDKKADELGKAVKAIEDLKNTKMNPKCYTAATFRDFYDEDNTPIAIMSGDEVIYTPALGAILASVDPNGNNTTDPTGVTTFLNALTGNVQGSAILAKDKDFYKLVKATYEYWDAINDTAEKDLEKIKEWIDGVEKAFEDDAARTGQPDVAAFQQWQINYNHCKAVKDARDAWVEKAKAYTGDAVPARTLSSYPTPESIKTFELLVYSTMTPKVATGEWVAKIGDKKFGGEQLALAKTLFPDFPEKMKEWTSAIFIADEDQTHDAILLKSLRAAYYAAAKAIGEDVDGANWDDLVKKYQEANANHVKVLENLIEEQEGIITTNTQNIADFEHGKPMIVIAIAQAALDLDEAEKKLEAATTALDYAKANLQRVMDYMKSLDANFLNGSELEFPWNATTTGGSTTGGSTTGGSTWPSFPWTI